MVRLMTERLRRMRPGHCSPGDNCRWKPLRSANRTRLLDRASRRRKPSVFLKEMEPFDFPARIEGLKVGNDDLAVAQSDQALMFQVFQKLVDRRA